LAAAACAVIATTAGTMSSVKILRATFGILISVVGRLFGFA
jgi:hypothetical protein